MVSTSARHTVQWEIQGDSGDSAQTEEVRSHCMGCIIYSFWFTNEGQMPSCDYGDFLKLV